MSKAPSSRVPPPAIHRGRYVTIAVEIILLIIAVIYFFPVYIMLANSLKTSAEIAQHPASPPLSFVVQNYAAAWLASSFGTAFRNSFIVTVISVSLLVAVSSLASYPLGRFQTRLSNALYVLFVSMLMLPFQMAMIPLYRMIYELQWINTFRSVILVFVAMNLPFSIFLYTGFIRSVPEDLEESATIEGAGRLRIFIQIVFPLLRPVTSSVIILNSLAIWNEFLLPLLFLQRRALRTIPVAVFSFQGQYNTNWPMLFAALVLAMAPMVLTFLVLQKQFVKGITAGSVKG